MAHDTSRTTTPQPAQAGEDVSISLTPGELRALQAVAALGLSRAPSVVARKGITSDALSALRKLREARRAAEAGGTP